MSAHILVIDDNIGIRNTIEEILHWQGYEIVTARNGIEGVTILQSGGMTPSLIISDWVMPPTSGGEFLQMLRATPAWQTLPLLFVSGADEQLMEPYWTGAERWLKKPFSVEDLLNTVQTLI